MVPEVRAVTMGLVVQEEPEGREELGEQVVIKAQAEREAQVDYKGQVVQVAIAVTVVQVEPAVTVGMVERVEPAAREVQAELAARVVITAREVQVGIMEL